jgi:hypothetical protein
VVVLGVICTVVAVVTDVFDVVVVVELSWVVDVVEAGGIVVAVVLDVVAVSETTTVPTICWWNLQ